MTYLEFRSKMLPLTCFNVNQVYSYWPRFNRNNLVRWTKENLLIRLRQGYYTFTELRGQVGHPFYFANRIYMPSYISLYTALSYYGMIPEAVVQITSITSIKTITFQNPIGEYVYKSIKDDWMFGYVHKKLNETLTIKIASPEKALLDLFYIFPFYNTEKEMEELRLDENYLHEDLNLNLLLDYTSRFNIKALDARVKTMVKTYSL